MWGKGEGSEKRRKGKSKEKGKRVPESAFGADTEILKDEPDAHPFFVVEELEGADAEVADEVAREHAAGLSARVRGQRELIGRWERALVLMSLLVVVSRLPSRRRWRRWRGVIALVL